MTERDYGTSELRRHFTVVPKLSGPNTMAMKVIDSTEIDRLLLDDVIMPSHHASLEGLMRRLHKAGFVGLKSPTYDSPIHADATAVGDKKANLIRSIVALFTRLDAKIGPGKRRALVDLVLRDVSWPGDNASLLDAVARLDDAIAGR